MEFSWCFCIQRGWYTNSRHELLFYYFFASLYWLIYPIDLLASSVIIETADLWDNLEDAKTWFPRKGAMALWFFLFSFLLSNQIITSNWNLWNSVLEVRQGKRSKKTWYTVIQLRLTPFCLSHWGTLNPVWHFYLKARQMTDLWTEKDDRPCHIGVNLYIKIKNKVTLKIL